MKRKVLCGFLFLMFAIVFSGCGGKNSDLSNSVEATYSPSYNGYATAEISFNEEKLDKLINNKKAIKVVEKAAEDNFLIEAIYELALESDEDAFAFDDFFNIVVESDLKKLSNGDMINFRIQANSDFLPSEDMTTVEFAKELGFNIESETFQYKVTGLEDVPVRSIDTDELLEVSFAKYDGYGFVETKVDIQYLSSFIIQEVRDDYISQLPEGVYFDISNLLSVEFDDSYNNLSNGDKVTVNLKLNDNFVEAGITLEDVEKALYLDFGDLTKTFTVSGLEKSENLVDLFKDVEQYAFYEGANGNGHLARIEFPDDYKIQVGDAYLVKGSYTSSLDLVYENKKVGSFSFMENYAGENLKKGDVVEVRLSSLSDFKKLEEFGYFVPKTKSMITVPDLGEYVTSKEQLNENVIKFIKAEICRHQELKSEDRIVKLYYATYNPGVVCDYDSTSFVVAIVEYPAMYGLNYRTDYIRDIIVKDNGEQVYIESYNKEYFGEESLDLAEKDLDTTKYTFEEIA